MEANAVRHWEALAETLGEQLKWNVKNCQEKDEYGRVEWINLHGESLMDIALNEDRR